MNSSTSSWADPKPRPVHRSSAKHHTWPTCTTVHNTLAHGIVLCIPTWQLILIHRASEVQRSQRSLTSQLTGYPVPEMDDLPPFLPPRRPTSVPNLPKERPSWQSFRTISPTVYDTPPPFLPPRRPSSARLQPSTGYHSTHTAGGDSLVHSRSGTLSRPDSLQSIPDTESTVPNEPVVERSDSARRRRLSSHQPLNVPQQPLRDRILQDGQLLGFEQTSPSLRQPPVLRHSSLRIASRIPEDADEHVFPGKSTLGNSHSDPSLCPDQYRPHSHPPARAATRAYSTNVLPPIAPLSALSADLETTDPYKLPPLSYGERTSPLKSPVLAARPRASLSRLSSLDNIITFREEKAQWKRASSILQQSVSEPALDAGDDHERVAVSVDAPPSVLAVSETAGYNVSGTEPPAPSKHRSTFRHSVGEIGFCFTIAMTQFLAEYLISGFAIELPRLFYDQFSVGPGSLGLFWPASLLSLILSATLLIFARLSDMYGGYPSFMFGIVWLTIWTLIPGFNRSSVMLDVARAMQGVAMAAFMPSTFAMVGSFYSEGPRKNFVLGLYSGCAPLGFFAGFLTAGALPASKPHWYFWIASALSCVTAITAYLAVPHDRTDRKTLGLKMDWPGSFLITAGLILLAYALAVEPYTNQFDHSRDGFSYPMVYGPFSSGVLCLLLALVWEGWFAMCPLLPFDFFRPPGVKAFCLAGLCFYASYGVWLYDSAEL